MTYPTLHDRDGQGILNGEAIVQALAQELLISDAIDVANATVSETGEMLEQLPLGATPF